jgi:flagellar motility protein MotE (MotC chaperone)
MISKITELQTSEGELTLGELVRFLLSTPEFKVKQLSDTFLSLTEHSHAIDSLSGAEKYVKIEQLKESLNEFDSAVADALNSLEGRIDIPFIRAQIKALQDKPDFSPKKIEARLKTLEDRKPEHKTTVIQNLDKSRLDKIEKKHGEVVALMGRIIDDSSLKMEDLRKEIASEIANKIKKDGNHVNIIGGVGGVNKLKLLFDVNVEGVTNGQTIAWNSTTEKWEPSSGGGGGATAWGDITGTLSAQTDLQTALDGKVDENAAITGATKTKITYDAKGLVTAGADATTADIADSSNKRYVTDAQLTVIGNTSGTNTGDQNLFGTIVVSGQSDVVADSTSDTLTLVAGSNVTITTDAATDSITIAASGGGGGAPTDASYVTLGTNGTLSDERVLTAGTGISVTDGGAGSTVTVASTITQYTDEMAQDAIGGILTDSSEIDFTYSDGTPSITASIAAGSIDETKLDTSVNASLDLADSAVQPAALSSYVPYTGAASDVDLGSNALITTTLRADGSGGLLLEANGGSDCLLLGAGGSANATAYGGWNFDGATANTIASFGASKTLTSLATATYPDLTELSYAKGVTSAIQTQLNGKQPLATVLTNTTASFTTALETKLNGIEAGAQVNAIDTVSDTSEIDLTIAAKALSASIVAGSIDETKLDTSVNASLDLADSAVQPARSISTTAPLTGGGDLSANRTLAITQATTSTDGYLSATDWNTFNNKQNAGSYLTGNQTITLSGDVTGSGATAITTTIAAGAVDIAMLSATGTPSGTTYLRGDNTWATIASGGDVTKVGTPANNQIGVWTGDGTIEGTSGLTYDGSILYAASYIGIGRTTPDCALDIDVTVNAARALQLYNSDTTIADGERVASIYFKQNDTSNPNTVHASIDAVGIGSTGALGLSFKTGSGGSTAERFYLSTNTAEFTVPVRPLTNDAAALGAATLSWSDLFLASGGVINFNNGNATLTHSTGLITSNVDIAVPDEAYGSGWNASTEVPTKNAVYDKLESMQMVYTLASDQATGANTTPVTLTDMVFTFEANSTYTIDLYGAISSAAATTGCGFQFDTSAAVTSNWFQFFHQLANTGTLSGGHSIADDTSAGVSSGVPALNTAYPVMGRGLIRTTSNTGTAQLRYRSETTAVTTCLAGTTMVVRKIA